MLELEGCSILSDHCCILGYCCSVLGCVSAQRLLLSCPTAAKISYFSLQMLSAEIGFDRAAEEGSEEAEAADNVAQGQATQATSMGAAIKDFLTTPQVPCSCFYPLMTYAFNPSVHSLLDSTLDRSCIAVVSH